MTVAITAHTVFDEGKWVREFPIEIGDEAIVWGSPRPDGSFEADQIWINVANIVGTISGLMVPTAPEVLRLKIADRYKGDTVVRIDPRTQASIRGGSRFPFDSDLITVKKGEVAQAIGRRMKDGSVLAVNFDM